MNIGDIYASTLAASSAAADLILVTPDEYTGFTPESMFTVFEGFIFQIVGDEIVNVSSDITDHYVENNSALQDHISLKPITVTVSGFVGELNNVVPPALEGLKEITDKIGVLDAYIPSITNSSRRAFNIAQQVYALSQKIVHAAKVGFGVAVMTKQQEAYNKLYNYWLNRTLFKVATPFGYFHNMAIQSIQATQGADSKHISDFSITFKEIKFADTKVSIDTRSLFGTDNRGSICNL